MIMQYFTKNKFSYLFSIIIILTINNTGIAQNKNIDLAHIQIKTVWNLVHKKKNNEALNLAKKALKTFKRELGKKDSTVANTVYLIGKVHLLNSQLDSAEVYLKNAQNLFKDMPKSLNKSYKFLGILYHFKGDYEKALEYCIERQKTTKKLYGANSTKMIDSYNRTIEILLEQENYIKADKLAQKALISADLTNNSNEKIKVLTKIADIANAIGDLNKATAYYKEALLLHKISNASDNRNIAIIYNNLASIFRAQKQFNKSIEYTKKAIVLLKPIIDPSSTAYGDLYLNIGGYYKEKNDYKNSILYIKKAIDILLRIHGENYQSTANAYIALGSAYANEGKDYNLAIKFTSKGLSINRTLFGDNHSKVAQAYTVLSRIYYQTKQFKLADSTIKEAINIQKKIYKSSHPLLIDSYQCQAQGAILKKKYSEALIFTNLADKLFPNEAITSNDFTGIINITHFFHNYELKNLAYKELVLNDKRYIDSLAINHNNSLAFQDHIQNSSFTTTAKDLYLKDAFFLNEEYIHFILAQSKKKDLEKIFNINEKTKARRLIESFNKMTYSKRGNPTDSLLSLENENNALILFYKKKKHIETSEIEATNDSLINHYENKIFELNRKQEGLENMFKTKHPKYHQLVHNTRVVSVKNIQEKLSEKQSLLEYFVGDENIFIFLITKNNYLVKQVKKDFPLKEWVQNLRKGIYGYWNTKKNNIEQSNKLYQNNAFDLYDKLVAPIKNNLTEEVIIIPDAELNFVPFDALLTNKADASSYLIKDHQISYNYSATHYLQLLNNEKKPTSKTVLAVAPSFKNNTINYESLLAKRSGLSNLEFNIPEAKTITKLFNGTLLESNNATKSNFLKQAKDYNIIHLSTHAKSNDAMGEFSYIAFQNDTDSTAVNNSRLYVNELYNLELNADLVVLSACETGLGELKRGEGVISLARGFTYAGAKSTLTSLWSVNDAQTTKLMESFYTNLKEGMTKGKALRQAKLNYLKNENLNAPYFWAGFIPAGDMSAVTTHNNYWYWVVGFLALLFFCITLYKKRIK